MLGFLELAVDRDSTPLHYYERSYGTIRYSQEGGNFRPCRRLASISHDNSLGKTGKFFVADVIIQLRDRESWKGKGFS